MNIHKVLLGAILIKPDLAPYSLPDLEIEHFPADLQPVFAALSGLWNAKGQLDAVEACSRYPEQRTAIMECVEECEGEYIAITRDRVEEWTQLVRERAALTQFQSLALQAGSNLTTFADLPDLYSQMGEALTLDREEQDFKPIGELVDTYIRKLDEKPRYLPSGISVLDKHLHLSPGNLFIIGGRPSAGKTALSLQIACEQARRGFRVCYFSLETDPDTLTSRIIANRLAVPLADVKAKTVPQSDLDSLADLHKLPLFIRSASGKGVGWVKAQAQRMKAQVVFIDYKRRVHPVCDMHDVKFQQRGQVLAVHPEVCPVALWHPIHGQIHVTVIAVVTSGAGAEQHEPPGTVLAGECCQLLIQFFHVHSSPAGSSSSFLTNSSVEPVKCSPLPV